MCLVINDKILKDFKRRTKDNNHRIIIYKELKIDFLNTIKICEYGTGQYKVLYSPIMRTIYKPGWNKAGRIRVEYGMVNNSIHAYRRPRGRSNDLFMSLKCWAYRKDVTGIDETEISFSKIFLPKKEYERALNAEQESCFSE